MCCWNEKCDESISSSHPFSYPLHILLPLHILFIPFISSSYPPYSRHNESEDSVIRVLLVDDEEPARDRLRQLLSSFGDFEVVGEAVDGEQALEKISHFRPD